MIIIVLSYTDLGSKMAKFKTNSIQQVLEDGGTWITSFMERTSSATSAQTFELSLGRTRCSDLGATSAAIELR